MSRSIALAAVGALLFAVAHASCADLPPLPAGICGNGVVEPPNEECDGNGTACRPAGDVAACHFDCSKGRCPDGHDCGADAVCRAPTAQFDISATVQAPSDVQSLAFGRFDDSGRQTLVATSNEDVRLFAFDAAGAVSSSLRLPIQRSHGVPTRFAADAYDGLVLAGIGGIDVRRARGDGTLLPSIYPSFPVPGTAVRLQPTYGLSAYFAEMFVFGGSSTGAALSYVARATQAPQVLAPIEDTVDHLVGSQSARLIDDGSSFCEQVVWAFSTQPFVSVYSPCRKSASGAWVFNDVGSGAAYKPPAHVALPSGTKSIASIFIADLDGDGHLDLFATTSDNAMFTSFGVGDGTFSSTRGGLADGKFSTFSYSILTVDATTGADHLTVGTDPPIAIGQLNANEDAAADFVTAHLVLMSRKRPGFVYAVSQAPASGTWTAAAIGDLNADGLNDAIAAVNDGNTIDYFGGTGLLPMLHASYVAPGLMRQIGLADVDGDRVLDAIFTSSTTPAVTTSPTDGGVDGGAETGGSSSPSGELDSLSIMFGRSSGYPEDPSLVGSLPSIRQLAVGVLEPTLVTGEGASGIGSISLVEASGSQLQISALAGRADRQLSSPFFLIDGAAAADAAPRGANPWAFVTGDFGSGSGVDLAAIATDLDAITRVVGAPRPWLVPMGAAASVTASSIRRADQPLDASTSTGTIVAVDLDPFSASAADELVVASVSKSGPTHVSIWRVNSGQFKRAGGFDLGGDAQGRQPQLLVADVDGDGKRDVALRFWDGGHVRLMVFWNDRTGSIGVASSSEVPSVSQVDGYTVARIDETTAKALVVVGTNGIRASRLTAGTRTLTPLTALPGVAGQLVGFAIGTGDIDGDGVADLAVAQKGGSIALLRGVPKLR